MSPYILSVLKDLGVSGLGLRAEGLPCHSLWLPGLGFYGYSQTLQGLTSLLLESSNHLGVVVHQLMIMGTFGYGGLAGNPALSILHMGLGAFQASATGVRKTVGILRGWQRDL